MPNEFEPIVNEYNKKLFKIIKKRIEDAIVVANNNRLDGINTYIYVTNALNETLSELAVALGYADHQDPPMTEDLVEQICILTEPLLQEARAEIQIKVDDIFNSKDLGELMDKYDKLMELFKNPILAKSMDLFEDIGPTNNNKTLT